MGRRKKSSIVGFSKDTLTVLGLLSLLIAFTFYIAAFIDNSTDNFFGAVQKLLGQTTILFAVYLTTVGLWLLGRRLFFTTTQSIIAQTALIILIPALVMSSYASKPLALAAIAKFEGGGEIGYQLAYNLFSDTLTFGQYTTLILAIATLIFIPLAFSLSLTQIIEYVFKFLSWLGKAISTLFVSTAKSAEELVQEVPDKVLKYGDLAKKQKALAIESTNSKEEKPELPVKIPKHVNVEVKEGQVGQNGLSQDELKYPKWQLPPLSLLIPFKRGKSAEPNKERNAKIIEQILGSFNIDASVVDTAIGPSVIRYAVSMPMSVKVEKLVGLSSNVALGLGVDKSAVRIENIPGTSYMGIEVPREQREMIRIKEILEAESERHSISLPIAVGKDIDGSVVVGDLAKMPHLLIAGATGSGKSVLTNSFIVSMLMSRTPDELRMILVDPKQVELSDYNGIPHLLTPVITDMTKVVNALKWAVAEMEQRYTKLAEAQVRDIKSYNEKIGFAAMPFIVIVIDEMADMMMTANKVDSETAIVRLAQKARAVGIHLVLATQRPSVNVITGIIKANIPGRIGMSVTSSTDSRVILDSVGAESLMGNGDLLFRDPKGKPTPMRLQGPNIVGEEITRVVNFIKSQTQEVEYLTSILETPTENGPGVPGSTSSDDDMFVQAVRIVVNYQKGSSSFLQRKLNIGFNRAARLLEEMEEAGIVGPTRGSKEREVLIQDADAFFNSKG